jgi:hypothetical protein
MMLGEQAKRIALAEILKHPRLKCAQRANVNQSAGIVEATPELPPLQPQKLEDITDEAKKASRRGDSGMFSPFLQDGEKSPDGNANAEENPGSRGCSCGLLLWRM